MRRRRLVSAVAAAIWLGGCNATFDFTAPPGEDQLYAWLYPYYAEFCAVSQIKKKPGFGADTSGGPGGHSVLYLNGVCRDRDAGYPTVALCTDDGSAAQQGVGLSVNAHFKNANWVATDSREFFFHGGLAPSERLTRAAYDRAQAQAERKGLLDGIVFHPEVFDDMPAGSDKHDYMYEVSIATDYAIDFGRDRYCARVPMNRVQMGKVVDYLNGVNAIYKDGQKDFVWNVLQNNCTHLAHNALAAAGLWDEWPTDRPILISAFDFPVPKNEFVNLMRRTNDGDTADLERVFDDDSARGDLMEMGRLPMAPGGLAEAERVMEPNDIYDSDVKLIFYDEPVFGSYQRRFREIFAEPRYNDIRANLRYFAALYRTIEAKRQPLADDLGGEAPREQAAFADFYARYYAYVERDAARVEAELAALDARPAVAGNQR